MKWNITNTLILQRRLAKTMINGEVWYVTHLHYEQGRLLNMSYSMDILEARMFGNDKIINDVCRKDWLFQIH